MQKQRKNKCSSLMVGRLAKMSQAADGKVAVESLMVAHAVLGDSITTSQVVVLQLMDKVAYKVIRFFFSVRFGSSNLAGIRRQAPHVPPSIRLPYKSEKKCVH
jgi:hypothetical protein